MKAILKIQGMHCPACKMLIEETVSDIEGVKSCTVDAKTGIAHIEHNASIALQTIKKAIEELGEYSVTIQT